MIIPTDYPVQTVCGIRELLEFSFRRHGNEIAFLSDEKSITYNQLYADICKLCSELSQYKGKYVVLYAQNKYFFCVAYFAGVISGCVMLLIPTMDDYYIDLCASIKTAALINDSFICSALSKNISYCPEFDIDVDEVCTILFSSGTMAEPKGVMLSQRNLCSDVVSGIQKFYSPVGARYLSILPYNHAFGLTCDMLTTIYTGGTICLPKSKLSFFSELAAYAPDSLYAPPAIALWIDKMLSTGERISDVTGGNLKKILCGGAVMPEKISKKLEQKGVLALGCYGMSECSPGISLNGDRLYRHGTSGGVMSCNQVNFENSEIIVKGTNVMKGYLNDPVLTKTVIRNGWFHTGDLGFLDDDGFLHVVGRLDNLITFSDGTKCVPEKAESLINSLEKVSESLVYVDGDRLKIKVCTSDNICDSDIKTHLKLAGFEHIDRISQIIISETPLERTYTGKIKRGE